MLPDAGSTMPDSGRPGAGGLTEGLAAAGGGTGGAAAGIQSMSQMLARGAPQLTPRAGGQERAPLDTRTGGTSDSKRSLDQPVALEDFIEAF